MSIDNLEKCYLLSCVPDEVREVLQERAELQGDRLTVRCRNRADAVQIQKKIVAGINSNPQCCVIRTATYLFKDKHLVFHWLNRD